MSDTYPWTLPDNNTRKSYHPALVSLRGSTKRAHTRLQAAGKVLYVSYSQQCCAALSRSAVSHSL